MHFLCLSDAPVQVWGPVKAQTNQVTLTPPPTSSLSLSADRLVGLVVRRPPRERKVPGSNPACAGIFSGSSHTSDLNIGTPVATLPGAWRYRVSAGTGQPGVSILWLGDIFFFSFVRWKFQSPRWRWQCIAGPSGFRTACGLRECGLARFPFWVARRWGRTAADVLLSDCQYRKGTAPYGQCGVWNTGDSWGGCGLS